MKLNTLSRVVKSDHDFCKPSKSMCTSGRVLFLKLSSATMFVGALASQVGHQIRPKGGSKKSPNIPPSYHVVMLSCYDLNVMLPISKECHAWRTLANLMG